jgi:dienelactone hydrolase
MISQQDHQPLHHRGNHESVRIGIGNLVLDGDLSAPEHARGVVVFAQGSGSSRHSPRNRFVAEALQRNRLATLLFDLLTPEEEALDMQTAQWRFDIGLLARRLIGALDWLPQQPLTRPLPVGCFGASTGAAAALVAAAERPNRVRAVVSRGGRPDLAGASLVKVEAPTLLIVGGEDRAVIGLNQAAFSQLTTAEKQLVIVPGATHLFEEPGALEEVAQLAARWFGRYLS